MTSWRVPNSGCISVRAASSTTLNSGVRWWIIGRAISSKTSGGTETGPGAKRYFFNAGTIVGTIWNSSAVDVAGEISSAH